MVILFVLYIFILKTLMKQLLPLLFLLIAGKSLFAQSQTVDFGQLERHTQRYADVTIRNHSEQSVYLVKIEHSPQIVYRVNKEYINPDSTFTIRIQINPDTIGKFDHLLRIYLSGDELPIELRVTGEVKEVPDYSDLLQQKCPEFTPEETSKNTEFTIMSVDAVTGEAIPKSTVTIINNGEISESWITGSLGTLRRNVSPGFLYFVVSHDGYETTETGVFITPEIETVFIPLKKNTSYTPEKETERPLTEEPVKIPEEQLEETLIDQITDAETIDSTETHDNWLDTNHYKPVNVVFVLDISSSMKLGEKMNLMKYALNQLTRNLRPQDRICFVTYAEKASVYLKPTSCMNKELILTKIAELEPEGSSSTTRGIKVGYRELLQHMQPGEANLVIVITDGAFNKYSDDYQKIVKRYASQNIVFSVVGIQCRSTDEKKMKEAAAFGKGSYVTIDKLSDAQVKLLQEIRQAAFVGN